MILSGWKRSATSLAKRPITRLGTFAPRYQGVGESICVVPRRRFIVSSYHDTREIQVRRNTRPSGSSMSLVFRANQRRAQGFSRSQDGCPHPRGQGTHHVDERFSTASAIHVQFVEDEVTQSRLARLPGAEFDRPGARGAIPPSRSW